MNTNGGYYEKTIAIISIVIGVFSLSACAGKNASSSVASNSSTSSIASSATVLSYDETQTVEQINIILARYKSGEYPASFFYYGNTHWTHIPDTVKLPQEITFDDLTNYTSKYEGGNNRWGNEYTSAVRLPLEDDYAMEFKLSLPPEGENAEDLLGPDMFDNVIIDLLGSKTIAEIELPNNAKLNNVVYDRVTLTSNLENYSLQGYDQTISGNVIWKKINGRFFVKYGDTSEQKSVQNIIFIVEGNTLTKVDYCAAEVEGLAGEELSQEQEKKLIDAVQPLFDSIIEKTAG